MAATIGIGLVLAPARRPEGQSGFALTLNRQIVVGGAGWVLVVERSGCVRRVPPGLRLRVPDDAGLGLVALGRDVERRLRRVGADRGGRGTGGGGWRRSGRSRGRAARGRGVRLLVERAADPVHHGPPGRAGGVAGGRW